MRASQKIQDLARQWADQRGLKLDALDVRQKDGLVEDVSAAHNVAPAAVRQALLEASSAATDAAGSAMATFQGTARTFPSGKQDGSPLQDAIASGSIAALAKATSQITPSGAGVAGVVGLQAAIGYQPSNED